VEAPREFQRHSRRRQSFATFPLRSRSLLQLPLCSFRQYSATDLQLDSALQPLEHYSHLYYYYYYCDTNFAGEHFDCVAVHQKIGRNWW
jgi:hypothetical protein